MHFYILIALQQNLVFFTVFRQSFVDMIEGWSEIFVCLLSFRAVSVIRLCGVREQRDSQVGLSGCTDDCRRPNTY